MMMEYIKAILCLAIAEGENQVISAVDSGPLATADALDRLAETLLNMRDAIEMVAGQGPCGDPDCPNCGSSPSDSEPDLSLN